ncbi:hypothetical protein MTR_4g129455 [Medicago truncatula]|uniref:Uncharacterized protein n=1 Tax=Medicago truncatula TaxID=3880 RepID=A0A072URY9_MEDTR|nr:hypothetical protein MTR_4g129455 [Medicago truncatula]
MSANLKFHFAVNSTWGHVYICKGLIPVKWSYYLGLLVSALGKLPKSLIEGGVCLHTHVSEIWDREIEERYQTSPI